MDIVKDQAGMSGGKKGKLWLTPMQRLRLGDRYFHNSEGNEEKKQKGLRLAKQACRFGVYDAAYFVASRILMGQIDPDDEFTMDFAVKQMCAMAICNYRNTRELVEFYCECRYKRRFGWLEKAAPTTGPLVDFDGKPFALHRNSARGRVKAVLEYKDGKNVLTLSTRVSILASMGQDYPDEFYDAIWNGMKAWEGEYTVFGGQRLTVRVNLKDPRLVGNGVVVFPVTNKYNAYFKRVSKSRRGETDKSNSMFNIMSDRRSFAVNSIISSKWKIRKKKIIYLQSRDGKFDNYIDITNTVKHEFGHSLGIGDMYEERDADKMGIEYGTYPELDCYYMYDKLYYSVMCLSCAPITNNDIEMVLLAYRDNEYQAYQLSKRDKKVSAALGRGN